MNIEPALGLDTSKNLEKGTTTFTYKMVKEAKSVLFSENEHIIGKDINFDIAVPQFLSCAMKNSKTKGLIID